MQSLLIIDAFALAFRSFYAYPMTLSLANGQPINAVFGMITLIFQAVEQYKPTHLVVCLDSPSPTFRHKQYAAYKANRVEAPLEFKSQVPLFKKAISDCGFFSVEKPGYEADDLIGKWSVVASENKLETFIYTGDQDTFQLVNDYVSIVMPKKGQVELKRYDRDAVFEKSGVYPESIVDFKALKGDSSDNIPGVKGIGDKTAAKLISEFSTLDLIYENLNKINSDKVKEKLLLDKENALISQKLARIVTDFEMDACLAECRLSLDWSSVYSVFKEYNFNRLLKKYDKHFTTDSVSMRNEISRTQLANVTIIDTKDKLKALLPKLSSGFSFDIETTSLCLQDAEMVGISFCFNASDAYYLPLNNYLKNKKSVDDKVQLFDVDVFENLDSLHLNEFLKLLKPVFEDETILKIAHNAKYDSQVLMRYQIFSKGIFFDTMIAAFLLYPLENVGLKALASRFFNYEMTPFMQLVSKDQTFAEVDIQDAAKYAAEDAFYTFQLKTLFEPLLKDNNLEKLFYSIECPVLAVLADMESTGVSIDLNRLHELNMLLSNEQTKLKERIYRCSGKEFNINSTRQLADVLFDDLNLPVIKKTKTGRSTNISVLEELKDSHEIITFLIEFRSNEKLLNTYINAFPHLVHKQTGKIHTTFNQAVVITGRLSSSSPNLQNIPIRNEKGALIRSVVKSRFKNGLILSADYSQIELRLMAHFSKDEAMIKAFNNNLDIHNLTASKMFHCDIADVTKNQRYQAKAVNFGIIYGISAFGLSQNINVSRKEAQQMIDDYFIQFPKIKTFIDSTISQATANGCVVTKFGRIRPLPDINSSNFSRRNFEQRAAVNTVLQGTAAELIKLAMVSIYKKINDYKLNSKMIIQVHDELVFDVDVKEKDDLIQLVKLEMQNIAAYSVELLVDIELSRTWQLISAS